MSSPSYLGDLRAAVVDADPSEEKSENNMENDNEENLKEESSPQNQKNDNSSNGNSNKGPSWYQFKPIMEEEEEEEEKEEESAKKTSSTVDSENEEGEKPNRNDDDDDDGSNNSAATKSPQKDKKLRDQPQESMPSPISAMKRSTSETQYDDAKEEQEGATSTPRKTRQMSRGGTKKQTTPKRSPASAEAKGASILKRPSSQRQRRRKRPSLKYNTAASKNVTFLTSKNNDDTDTPTRKRRRKAAQQAISAMDELSDEVETPATTSNTSTEDQQSYYRGAFYTYLEGDHENSTFEVDEDAQKIALSVVTLPRPNTLQHDVSKSWGAKRMWVEDADIDTTPTQLPVSNSTDNNDTVTRNIFSSAVEPNLRAFYHVIRANLVEGNIMEALELCHGMLRSSYKQAEAILGKRLKSSDEDLICQDDLLILREKIAGTWSLYAHMFLQIMETDLFLGFYGNNNNDRSSMKRVTILSSMEEKLWDHAIAILTIATTCPLAGNHAAITLALSRLRFRQRQREKVRPFPRAGENADNSQFPAVGSAEHWRRNLEIALHVCRDGLERSSPPSEGHLPAPSKYVVFYERFGLEGEMGMHQTTKGVVPVIAALLFRRQELKNPDVAADIAAVTPKETIFSEGNYLPKRLKSVIRQIAVANNPQFRRDYPNNVIPYLLQDQNSARLVCMEMNQLSRLEQSIAGFNNTTVLQIICTPKPVPNSSDPNDAGIKWHDFMFFQTMDMVLLQKNNETGRGPIFEVDQPSNTPAFFATGASCSVWQNIADAPPRMLASRNHPVVSNISYACTGCGSASFETQSELAEHKEICSNEIQTHREGDAFGNDSLTEQWIDSLLVRKVKSNEESLQDASVPHSKGLQKDAGTACDIVDYACQKCFKHGFRTEEARDVHKATCRRERNGDSHQDKVKETKRNEAPDTVSEAIVVGTFASADDTENSAEIQKNANQNRSSKSTDNVLSDTANNKVHDKAMGVEPGGKGENDKDLRRKRTKQDDSGRTKKTTRKQTKKRPCRQDLRGVLEEETGIDDAETVCPSIDPTLLKRMDLKNSSTSTDQASPQADTSSSESKKTRNEAAASAGRCDEIVASSKMVTEVSTVTKAALSPPKKLEVFTPSKFPKNNKKQKKPAPPLSHGICCSAMAYACRKCSSSDFSTEEERDSHERSCDGQYNSAKVVLQEVWPDLVKKPKLTGLNPHPAGKTDSDSNTAGRPVAVGPSPETLRILERRPCGMNSGTSAFTAKQNLNKGHTKARATRSSMKQKRGTKEAAPNPVYRFGSGLGRALLGKTSSDDKPASSNSSSPEGEEKKVDISIDDEAGTATAKFIPIVTGGR